MRVAGLFACLALGACAHGVCEDCPTAQLTANGETMLAGHVGDSVSYAWTSTNADTAASTVEMSPAVDQCGNQDGPWVVSTTTGTVGPVDLLPCQAGTTYTLAFTATQSSTGDAATATLTISVE